MAAVSFESITDATVSVVAMRDLHIGLISRVIAAVNRKACAAMVLSYLWKGKTGDISVFAFDRSPTNFVWEFVKGSPRAVLRRRNGQLLNSSLTVYHPPGPFYILSHFKLHGRSLIAP